jgi:sporulation protein YlmC with PRC-barrel domain
MTTILLSVQRLKGFEVYDLQEEKLGVIGDIMLDIGSAKVRYAVLDATSAAGADKKRFAVPLPALRLDTENECFVLEIDREGLAHASGFDPGSPPSQPDPLFARPTDDSSSSFVSRPRP